MLTPDKLDINFLKSDEIGKVLAKGLAVVYKEKPKYPIDFFAKWLLNESKTKDKHSQLENIEKDKEALRLKQVEQNVIKQHKFEEQQKAKGIVEQEEATFKEEIQNHLFHQSFLCKEFCDYLVKRDLTGVYVGYVDYPPKEFKEDEDDDEQAHLQSDQPKVINYVGACESHRFLIGKTLPLDQGVTGRVFQEPQADTDEPQSRVVYVPSVVHEPKMVYFKWPKLGAYFAVPLVYNSCLFDQALDQGIEQRQIFRKALAEQLKERETKDLEYQEKIRVATEANEDPEALQALQDEYAQWKAEQQDLKEPDFASQKREFVVCFDTLGRDTKITAISQAYFEEYVNLFAEQWEAKEKQLLSKDIDFMINYYESVNIKERSDQLTAQEDAAVESSQSRFDDVKEREKEYQFELQSVRLLTLTQQLSEPSLFNDVLALKEMRILKFPGILQAVLLFLGYEKSEINLPGTNVLDWVRVKELLNEGFFEKISAYTHRGPKLDPVKPYAKLNRISKRLEKYDLETVENYNLGYGKLFKWIQLTLQLRKADIEIRRIKIEERRQLRENRMNESQKIKDAKENALIDHKAGLSPEDQETFNQAEWEANYDAEHPLPDIPDEVENDIDEDWSEE